MLHLFEDLFKDTFLRIERAQHPAGTHDISVTKRVLYYR